MENVFRKRFLYYRKYFSKKVDVRTWFCIMENIFRKRILYYGKHTESSYEKYFP